jgi:hypothetical protein
MKTMLLAGACMLALAPAAASAARHDFPPRDGTTVLYDQSSSSGFAKYAVVSWYNISFDPPYSAPDLAADDFIIPGTGTHKITAVYVAGTTGSKYEIPGVSVIFFDNLKYDKKTGKTTAVVKAKCPYTPFSDGNGIGDLLIDVSSCNAGAFKGGHDYAVSVQGFSAGGTVWYWQTNKKRLNRPGMWYDYGGGGNGPCYTQLMPIKTCFPTAGYGPDLAFAIIGN